MKVRTWLSAELVMMLVPSGVLGNVSDVARSSCSVPLSSPEIVVVSLACTFAIRRSNFGGFDDTQVWSFRSSSNTSQIPTAWQI